MYTLGDITLPYPKKLTRKFVELSAENFLITGKSTKKTQNRREQYILEYQNLTPADAGSILSEYELEAVRWFTVTEDNLSIGPTQVLVDIEAREYPPSGELYRQNLRLVLTEII